MNLKRNAILSMMAIAAPVLLLAGSPIVANHQAFAMSFPPGYAKILNSIVVGPCVGKGNFMYLVCSKFDPSLLNNGAALKSLLVNNGTTLKNLLVNNGTTLKNLLVNNGTTLK